MRKKILFVALLGLGAVITAGAAIAANFDHAVHVSDHASGDCKACHQPSDKSIVPATAKCKACHDDKLLAEATFPALKTHGALWSLQHRQAALRNQDECMVCHSDQNDPAVGCSECHNAGFSADQGSLGGSLTNVHRGEFKVSHPVSARSNQKLCASCHENSFCTDCHEAFRPEDLRVLSHRKGFSNIQVGAVSHKDFTQAECTNCHTGSVLPSRHLWTADHAREARRNLSSCQSCHADGDVCITCHSAKAGLSVNPHPKGWEGSKASRMKKASDAVTCKKCH